MSLREVSMSRSLPVHHLPYLGLIKRTPRVSEPDMMSSLITRSFLSTSGIPFAWYSTRDAIATSGNM
ncbi:hypothetical protein MT325_m234R [Paramecium bursaria chlorella virus MT325]|uniref:Uncharacterized protein m234R n=1 Tax=Paramecium bursaria Chlorella virus MT325 TaxID=346932 RepID=A7ITW4_PBCVM|nr:hypothetical protein MT325_m234R [Paramecium bursaria chlorella virus MT325]